MENKNPSGPKQSHGGKKNWKGKSQRSKCFHPYNKQNEKPTLMGESVQRDHKGDKSQSENDKGSQKHNFKERPNYQSSDKSFQRNAKNRDKNHYGGFTFKYLKDLSTITSEEAMVQVAKNEEEFKKLMTNQMRPDLLVLTLKVLTNICRANFTATLSKIINQACSSNFLQNLENYLTKLPFESLTEKSDNKLYHEDPNSFWYNLIEFFQKIIEIMFRTACDKLTSVLQKIERIILSIEMSQNYKLDDGVKKNVSKMVKDLEKEIQKIEKSSLPEKIEKEFSNDSMPLENFRGISVFPTIQDLLDEKVFLRPCNIKAPYDSVDHYLDVHFRLLREDFVRPLRNGVKEFLNGAQKYRNNDFRIYKNTRLISFEVNEFNAGIRLYFGKLNFVDWRRSKRLIFGALLLLSNNNFNTVIFATVSNRDLKDLVNGYVTIEPCTGTIINPAMYNCNLVLLESKIYFEPYYVILSAMQNINEKNFPMEKYLIRAETSPTCPKYLDNVNHLLFKNKFKLPINDDNDWPTAKVLKLDESQYNAFKSALTQEFSVIQGPPGTGKTFLALEIVQALLENNSKWNKHGPIVVVCLTNHALDQFLEGILCHTKSIVRVGSRSKSDTLKPYALAERRKELSRRNCANSLVYDKKRQIEDIFKSVSKLRLFIKYLTAPNSVVPLSAFQNCQNEIPLKNFKSTDELVFWLIGMEVTPLIEKPKISDENNSSEKTPKDAETPENESDDYMIFEDCQNIYTDVDIIYDYAKLKAIDNCGAINPLEIFDRQIAATQYQIRQLTHDLSSHLPFSPIFAWEEFLEEIRQKRENIRLELSKHPLKNPNNGFSNDPRWQQYWSWVQTSYDYISEKIINLEESYRQLNSELSEIRHIADLEVMKNHQVIGLTTTCAAKIQSSLRALGAPIVLVEEAAEILEAHVVCAITKACQHVILIGDHKQLRPKASVYELGSKFNLNISLFERMVNIRGECAQLAYQHRMRPQIAKLIAPIYETLYNDKSVYNYPNVKGLNKNLFFLNHSSHEECYKIDDSYMNKHEVEFLTAFAKHLIMQGYSPDEITILCTYTGQLFAFMNETHRHALLRQVRVTTVDNYQGEENKIILLSLVRNNGESKVGFLKEENRVCVALSRAREGLYIMGNMRDLLGNNNIWPKIQKILEEENAIGDYLTLRCQIHSDQFFEMKHADDFKQCPEGGCLKKCDLLLPCGHSCTSVCHILDREHKDYHCKQNCNKACPSNHPCELKCWQDCQPCKVKVERTLKCGHTVQTLCSSDPNNFPCPVEVDVTLPDCNHAVKKPCYLPVEKCMCTYRCETRLDCGHSCLKMCHVRFDPEHIKYTCLKACTKKNVNCTENHICKKRCHEECEPCFELVDKRRSCQHYFRKVACSMNIEDIFCKRKCLKIMSCGHPCKLECSEKCKNCHEMVTKQSSCGHEIRLKCHEEATPFKCNNNCSKTLPCGHKCTKKCKESCTIDCRVKVLLNEPGLCGHRISVPCFLKNSDPKSRELVKYCEEPCHYVLACTHECKGNCGSCFQGRVHIPCSEPCREVFICGHTCKIACNSECQPCTQKCELKCGHNKCNKKCGIPCVVCKEPCKRKCVHQRCEKLCYEMCDVEPCDQPCKKKLKCSHQCVGYCGDICPPLCRICHKDQLTEIFFGNEDEPDARFILLPDCGHCIEVDGLMQYIRPATGINESREVKTPTCPKCRTPIRSCNRIMNEIKEDLKNVIAVKEKVFFNNKKEDVARKQIEYVEALKKMSDISVFKDFSNLKIYINYIKKLGTPVKKGNKYIQNLNFNEVKTLGIISSILEGVVALLKKIKQTNISMDKINTQLAFLVNCLPSKFYLSKQRLGDIQAEVKRLQVMVYVYNLFSQDSWVTSEGKRDFDSLMEKLSGIKKFTEEMEAEIIKSSNTLNARKNYIMIERAAIIKAVSAKERLHKGSWFKCPNGHYYAIGECGGATEQSKCIECKAPVGGHNHQVVQGNSLASELDGATQPAYPTALRY